MTNSVPKQPKSWRDYLAVHPAADLFPLLAEYDPDAFKELVDDIKVNGLIEPIVFWGVDGQSLLDGRNRLDALEALGLLYVTEDGHLGIKKWTGQQWIDKPDDRIGFAIDTRSVANGDPYAIALSLNVHRRHLTADQKRDLIAKVLKAKPEASDRQIGRQVKADNKTVAKVRSELEGREEIPHVETRTDSKGRKQPSQKSKSSRQSPARNRPRGGFEQRLCEQQVRILNNDWEHAGGQAKQIFAREAELKALFSNQRNSAGSAEQSVDEVTSDAAAVAS